MRRSSVAIPCGLGRAAHRRSGECTAVFLRGFGHTGLRLCVKKVKTGRPFYLYVSLF